MSLVKGNYMYNNYDIKYLLDESDHDSYEKIASKKGTLASSETIKIAEKLNEAANKFNDNNFKIASSKNENQKSFKEKVAESLILANSISEIEKLEPLINFVKEATAKGFSENEAIEFFKKNPM